MIETLHLSLKNLKIFITQYSLVFFITILTLITSSITMMYVIVKLDCHSDNLSTGDVSMNVIELNNLKENISIQNISDRLISYKESNYKVDCILGVMNTSDLYVTCIIDDENYHLKKINGQNSLINGRFFTDDEINMGNNLLLTAGVDMNTDYTVKINGCEYSVIGCLSANSITNAYMPLQSAINNNIIPNKYKIVYTEYMSIDKMEETIAELRNIFPEMKIETMMDYYSEKGILSFDFENSCLLVMAIVALFSCAYLYLYIISMRIKQIYIFKICGATNARLVGISIVELIYILVIQFVPSFSVFRFILIPFQKKYDVVFYYGYSYSHILIAFLILTACAIIIYLPVLIKIFSKSAVEIEQNRR